MMEDFCFSIDRRSFLSQLGMAAVAAAVLPISTITALSASTREVRYPIPAADGAFIDKDNEVILVRWQKAVYAFSRSCPHQRTALRWREKDGRFQCPKHKSKYEPDGTFIEGRATRGMDRYQVTRDGEIVVVETSVLFKQSENAGAWASARVTV